MFNDGTAMVLFIVFRDAMAGTSQSFGSALGIFLRLSFGGLALGLAAGVLMVYCLRRLHFDSTSQIAITFLTAYFTFVLAEDTPLHVSGVLAVVTLGLMMAASGRTAVGDHHAMHSFWEMVEYLANTVVFVLAGALVFQRGFSSDSITGRDWALLLALFVVLHVARGVAVCMLRPALSRLAYGVNDKEMVVLTYAGLRGAVGLVLALFVAEDPAIDRATATQFLFHMSGIATLTLLVNGSSTGALLRWLGLVQRSHEAQQVFMHVVKQLQDDLVATAKRLQSDRHCTGADWGRVEEFLNQVYQPLLAQLQMDIDQAKLSNEGSWGEFFRWVWNRARAQCRARREHRRHRSIARLSSGPVHAHTPFVDIATIPATAPEDCCKYSAPQPQATQYSASPEPVQVSIADAAPLHVPPAFHERAASQGRRASLLRVVNPLSSVYGEAVLCEGRNRFLLLVKAQYWELFEAGAVSDAAVRQLLEATSAAQDHLEHPLHDWRNLQRLFERSHVMQLLQHMACSGGQKVLFHFVSFEYDVATAFVRAHAATRKQLPSVVVNQDIVSQIVGESQRQCAAAQAAMQEIQGAFGEITMAIKTRQVLRMLLRAGTRASNELASHGDLEGREVDLVRKTLHSAWQRAKVHTALVPDEREMLREIGYLRELDAASFAHFQRVAQRTVFPSGALVVSQATRVHGIYVIMRGSVSLWRRTAGAEHDAADVTGVPPAALPGEFSQSWGSDIAAWFHTWRTRCGRARKAVCHQAGRRLQVDAVQEQPGMPQIRKLGTQVGTMRPGGVLGMLSLLSNSKPFASAVAQGPVVAMFVSQRDLADLLHSRAASGQRGPVRSVTHLEEKLCKMAAISASPLPPSIFPGLTQDKMDDFLTHARLVRPEAKQGVVLHGPALILTGAKLEVVDEHAVQQQEVALRRARAGSPASSAAAQDKAPCALPENVVAPDSAFRVVGGPFTWLAYAGERCRHFAQGTRLLVLPATIVATWSTRLTATAGCAAPRSTRVNMMHSAVSPPS